MAFDPISTISTLVNTVVDKIFPDANKKLDVQEAKVAVAAALEQMKLKGELDLVLGQLAINQEEAKSSSTWVAGWRPYIGWICGTAMGYYYILQPLLIWIFDVFGIETSMPALNSGELMTVLLGMLGLGALRSFDKKATNGKTTG